MDKRPVRFAVIGLGMAAKPHLEALAELAADVDVSGIYNRSRDKALAVAQHTGYHVFESVEEIAADETTEAAIVITPPNQRLEIIKTLAAANIHLLMEKPVERTRAAAEEIVTICENAGVKLGIVFQHRFRAGAQRLSELIKNGDLGELALIRTDIPWWREQSYYDVAGRGSYERDGGGVLISQAIHMLDYMLSLTGPAASVQAQIATTPFHSMEAEDFAMAGVQFVSGAVGSIVATTATFPGTTESLVIDGSKGSAILKGGQLEVNWRDGRQKIKGEESGTGAGADPMAFPCDWHRDLIADFARAIREDREPAITGREALRVHALIDAIVESSAKRTATEVQQVQ